MSFEVFVLEFCLFDQCKSLKVCTTRTIQHKRKQRYSHTCKAKIFWKVSCTHSIFLILLLLYLLFANFPSFVNNKKKGKAKNKDNTHTPSLTHRLAWEKRYNNISKRLKTGIRLKPKTVILLSLNNKKLAKNT